MLKQKLNLAKGDERMRLLSTHHVLCLAVKKNVKGSRMVSHNIEGTHFYEVNFDSRQLPKFFKIAEPFNTYIEMKQEGWWRNGTNGGVRGKNLSYLYSCSDA